MGSNREQILAVAQRVLTVDATTSVAAIAEAAGVSRATMHRHFESRDALLVELGTRSLDQWQRRMDDAALEEVAASRDSDRIRVTLETLVLGYVEDSEAFGFALTDHVVLASPDLVERTERLADREATLFAAAQETGLLRAGVPPRWFGHAVYGLLVAGREATRLGDVARRDVPDLVLSSLLHGVSAR